MNNHSLFILSLCHLWFYGLLSFPLIHLPFSLFSYPHTGVAYYLSFLSPSSKIFPNFTTLGFRWKKPELPTIYKMHKHHRFINIYYLMDWQCFIFFSICFLVIPNILIKILTSIKLTFLKICENSKILLPSSNSHTLVVPSSYVKWLFSPIFITSHFLHWISSTILSSSQLCEARPFHNSSVSHLYYSEQHLPTLPYFYAALFPKRSRVYCKAQA